MGQAVSSGNYGEPHRHGENKTMSNAQFWSAHAVHGPRRLSWRERLMPVGNGVWNVERQVPIQILQPFNHRAQQLQKKIHPAKGKTWCSSQADWPKMCTTQIANCHAWESAPGGDFARHISTHFDTFSTHFDTCVENVSRCVENVSST